MVSVVVLRTTAALMLAFKSSRVVELVTIVCSWFQFLIVRGQRDCLYSFCFDVDLPQSVSTLGSIVTYFDDAIGFCYRSQWWHCAWPKCDVPYVVLAVIPSSEAESCWWHTQEFFCSNYSHNDSSSPFLYLSSRFLSLTLYGFHTANTSLNVDLYDFSQTVLLQSLMLRRKTPSFLEALAEVIFAFSKLNICWE